MSRRKANNKNKTQGTNQDSSVSKWERWYARFQRRPLIYFTALTLAVISSLIAFFSTIISGSADFESASRSWSQWLNLQDFPPQAENETLIIVVPFFRTEGVIDTDAHNEIINAIQERKESLGLLQLRVNATSNPLRASDFESAKQILERYKASVIIWGEDTGTRVTVSFYNPKNIIVMSGKEDYNILPEVIELREIERTQIGNSEEYGQFITTDLPKEISFLSLFVVGAHYTALRDFEAAANALTRAVTTVPEETKQSSLVANSYILLSSIQHSGLGRSEESLKSLARAKEIRNDAFVNFAIGNTLSDIGRLEEAISAYEEAVTIDPLDYKSFYNIGQMYYKLGKLPEALSNYDEAISIKSNYAKAYAQRAGVHEDLGDFDLAIKNYEMALQYRTESELNASAVYYNLGLIYRDKGNFQLSVDQFSQAIKENDRNADAYWRRGILFDDYANRPRDAINDFQSAIAVNPNNPNYHYSLGVTLGRMGLLTEAKQAYDNTLRIDQSYWSAWLNRGVLRYKLKDFAGSLEDLNEALRTQPTHAKALTMRGDVHVALGNKIQALADYKMAGKYSQDINLTKEIEEKIRILQSQS